MKEPCLFFPLLALFLGDDPDATIRTICVDRIEHNHFYDDSGRLTLKQYIAWSRHPADDQIHVMFWILDKDEKISWTRHMDNSWSTIIEKENQFFRIKAGVKYESHTIYDPELRDRELLPKHERHGFPKRRFVPIEEK